MFAGVSRQFSLKPSRYSALQRGIGYESIGSIGELFHRSRALQLGNSECRQIIAHALAGPDDPVGFMLAMEEVDAEMDEKPIANYLPLVADIVVDAFSGLADDGN